MCKFFSLVSDGKGFPMYFDWANRKRILKGKLKYDSADSHTSIADYYGYKGEKEDELNKYEYNPLTGVFTVDQINTTDDSKDIEKFCKNLDFKEVIKPLIIKKIINPFTDLETIAVTKEDIALVEKWDSVEASVWVSVRASVRASVGASVWDSVGASVWASVGASVGASVWASVRASVGASVGVSVWVSVGASVGVSVWVSVWAYCSSFMDIKYKHDFSSAIKLWEKGLVPSFDGKIWRLHGKGGKILWEGIK